MATNKWVIHTATGEFRGGGFLDPTPPAIGIAPDGEPIYDPAFSVVELPSEAMPDRRTERYDAASPTKRRAATVGEQADYDTARGQDRRSRELTMRALKALATATHRRCKRIEDALAAASIPGAAPVTAAQWQTQLEAEWDALSAS